GFNHILFADDIFLFAKANIQDCTTPFNLFLYFCEVSSQICNATKSKLFFSWNTHSDTQCSISSLTNMPFVQDLGKYLGMPLLTKRKSTPTFQPLLDKIHTRIHAWQSKLLSQAGKLTLIISILSPLIYYQMQTIVLPWSTTSSIDRSTRDFLWGDTQTQGHVYLINWDMLTKPKVRVRLGIRDSKTTNDAFLMNQAWRIWRNLHSLLAKFLSQKHYQTTDFLQTTSHTGSHLWKALLQGRDLLQGSLRWIIRNGCNINFWTDHWIPPRPIRGLIHGLLLPHEYEFKVARMIIDTYQ
ncbi:putative ribonuclease h protein, partial [Quercus suber]